MRKLLSVSIFSIIGILVSTLVIVGTTTSTASAQTSSVTIRNVTPPHPDDVNVWAATVDVSPADGCDPGSRTPQNTVGGSYFLDASESTVTGALSQQCDWLLDFTTSGRDTRGELECPVSITVKGSDGTAIGNPVITRRGVSNAVPLRLFGVGGNGPLKFGDYRDVASIDFEVVRSNCDVMFVYPVTISYPQDVNPFANEFDRFKRSIVAFAADNLPESCRVFEPHFALIGSAQYPLRMSLPLVKRPAGATTDCSYFVAMPASFGGLGLQSPLTTAVDADSAEATVVYAPRTPSSSPNSSVRLTNLTAPDANQPGNLERAQVVVDVLPAVGCDPGSRTPSQETYTFGATSVETGILSQNCDWKIEFRNLSDNGSRTCLVEATVKDHDGNQIGASVLDRGAGLVLSGVGGDGPLKFGGYRGVAEIEFERTDVCSTVFYYTVNLTGPAGATPFARGNPLAGGSSFVGVSAAANLPAGCKEISEFRQVSAGAGFPKSLLLQQRRPPQPLPPLFRRLAGKPKGVTLTTLMTLPKTRQGLQNLKATTTTSTVLVLATTTPIILSSTTTTIPSRPLTSSDAYGGRGSRKQKRGMGHASLREHWFWRAGWLGAPRLNGCPTAF